MNRLLSIVRGRPSRSLCARTRARLARVRAADGGFILLESIIAITLITVIMGAVGIEYVGGLSGASHQRATTAAVQLADSAMEGIRALHATDLLTGRGNSAVMSERTTLAAIPAIAPWISTVAGQLAYDSTATATSGASATVPTSALTQTANGRTFNVYEYLECSATSSTGACLSASRTAINYIRAIIAVTWQQAGCANGTCSYVTSTLISADGDPTFDVNQPVPAPPTLKNTATSQTVAVNDNVSIQLVPDNNTGVAPFLWQLTGGSLPSGLAISPAGLISGTVTGSAGTASSTLQVTDGFNRTATITISWTILAALQFAAVSAQSNVTTDTVNLTVSATGGAGGYTYTDPNTTLPTGLSISSAGTITGRPTTKGNYAVTLVVTDSAGRTASTSFTWSVAYPPLGISNPGAQTSTVNRADTVALSASGGDGNYSWSASGLPAGMTINAGTGVVSGTPTTTGTSTVTFTVTDSAVSPPTASTSVKWTVYAAPSVNTPPTQTSTISSTPTYSTSATCPNSPCSYAISGQPNGLVINASTGVISGTVASNAVTSTNVKVTVTDASGATASSSAFTWTINAKPTITSPGNQTTARSTAVSLNMASAVSGGTAPYTYSASTLPAGLSINSSTGVISGTTGSANSDTSNITVTVRDASGVTASTSTFAWHVSNLVLAIPDSSFPSGTNLSGVSLTSYTSGGTTPYTYGSFSGLPPWMSIASSGAVSGTAAKGTWNISVTVTDSVGATSVDTAKITVT